MRRFVRVEQLAPRREHGCLGSSVARVHIVAVTLMLEGDRDVRLIRYISRLRRPGQIAG